MEKTLSTPATINELCLLVGKVLLTNGAETYRVEDTMQRISSYYGFSYAHSFVTPTGIIFAADEAEETKFVRILERTSNFHKVIEANSISRGITNGEYSITEAIDKLKMLEKNSLGYSIPVRIIAAAIMSACFAIMFQGGWNDFLPTLVTACLGYTCFLYLHRLVKVQFFAEFLASFVIGLIAYGFIVTEIGHEIDKIIIGSVMPLVPGLLITNAVRDLMAGHLVSGLSKGAEAFLTAFAIGAGIAFVFSIY